jgi:hypothetical protein
MTTCREGVYIGNKHNYAQLTNIHYWDDSGTTWSGNLIGSALPYNLLPDPPAVDDLVLFGIDTAAPHTRQFCSLVFDLAQALTGVTTVWRSCVLGDGADPTTWSDYGGALDDILDNTWDDGLMALAGNALNTLGVKSAHWGQENMISVNPQVGAGPALGITGYWVCLHVSAVTGALQVPQQQNREIYTITWPYIDISVDDIEGDLPAVPQILLKNESDKGGIENPTIYTPALYQNRVMVASRSLTRRGEDCSDFSAFLNASDEQNPLGISFETGGGAGISIATRYHSATGRALYVDGAVAGLTGTCGRWYIDATYSAQYYGKYHVYLMYEQAGGSAEDINFRLWVKSSREATGFMSNRGYSDAVANDHRVVDMGELTLGSPSQLLGAEDARIRIDILYERDAAVTDMYIYGLVIMPVDEWAGEFVCPEDSTTGLGWRGSINGVNAAEQRYILIDGYGVPKVGIRCPMLSELYGEVMNLWSSYGTPPRLVPNTVQRLWFFAHQGDYSLYPAGPYEYRVPPESAMSIELRVQQRYSSARGDR